MSEYMTAAELAHAYRAPLRTLQRWAKLDGWRRIRCGRSTWYQIGDAQASIDARRHGAHR